VGPIIWIIKAYRRRWFFHPLLPWRISSGAGGALDRIFGEMEKPLLTVKQFFFQRDTHEKNVAG